MGRAIRHQEKRASCDRSPPWSQLIILQSCVEFCAWEEPLCVFFLCCLHSGVWVRIIVNKCCTNSDRKSYILSRDIPRTYISELSPIYGDQKNEVDIKLLTIMWQWCPPKKVLQNIGKADYLLKIGSYELKLDTHSLSLRVHLWVKNKFIGRAERAHLVVSLARIF